MRSVSCDPGCSEFTVTPSAATSRASVLRKPVTPARAVFDRISVGIGWRTAIDVIATTLPHRCACIAGTASLHIAIAERQFSSNAAWYASRSVDAKSPAAAHHRWRRGCRRRRARRARRARTAAAPVLGRHVGDERHRAGDRRRRRFDPLLRPAADRDVDALGRQRRRGRAAETLRRGRHRRPPARDPQVHQWASSQMDRARRCRASDAGRRPVRTAMISAQIEIAVSSGVRAPMSSPIGAMDPRQVRRRRRRPRAAARPAWRACAASPSRRGSRRRWSSAPTIAGTSNLVSWVSTHTASRGPSSSPTFAR